MRRAKIVCTIGPATRDEKTLRRLIDAGMDVARLNFSHGTEKEHREIFARIRASGERVAVMQDLMGPKIRVGDIGDREIRLAAGETVVLSPAESAGADSIPVTYPALSGDLSPGDTVYIADGTIHLEVAGIDGSAVRCTVVHGGTVTSRKGVNLPGVNLRAPALTEKDRRDLALGLELGVDLVALSFVRSHSDVLEVKRIVGESGSNARIVAKIEKREAVDELASVIEAADALMIARGDLGVEISTEEVPVVQKRIIGMCVESGTPVITATQMLESMVRSERPTRAEASDVANAVIDGSDALMLSAETAMGDFPVGSVRMMDRIIRRTEMYIEGTLRIGPNAPVAAQATVPTAVKNDDSSRSLEGVCASAVTAAGRIGASAIACLTHTGRTARMIAKFRPGVPIFALTDNPPVIRQMSLVWGVRAIPVERIEETERILTVAREKVWSEGFRGPVVLTAGIPTKDKGETNTIHLLE